MWCLAGEALRLFASGVTKLGLGDNGDLMAFAAPRVSIREMRTLSSQRVAMRQNHTIFGARSCSGEAG
jgi:hypothetical protein